MRSGPASRLPRAMLAVALFALAVRLLLLALTLTLIHTRAMAPTPAGGAELAALHDGREYGRYAAALGSPAALAELPAEVRRLGPGYPLLVRPVAALVPLPWAALAVALLAAALATALLPALGVPPRAAALFAVLTPSWLAFSTTAMSEAPFLALALLGLLAWRRGAGGAAGLAFGAAALVRPVGAVLFAALWLSELARLSHQASSREGEDARGCKAQDESAPQADCPYAEDADRPATQQARSDAHSQQMPGEKGGLAPRRSRRRHLAAALAFPLLPASWTAWAALAWGQPAAQVATYVRRDAALPLSSFAAALADPLADPLKLAQNLVVLALVAVAAVLLWRRWRGAPEPARAVPRQWFWWLTAQTGFYLLLPSSWVFECLPRFLVTALPAVVAALAPHLPRRGPALALLLALLTAVSAGIALLWNLRALGVAG